MHAACTGLAMMTGPMTGHRRLLAAIAVVIAWTAVFAHRADASESAELWRALHAGEAFAIMRHAIAPGIGDPANFDVGDCTTQRILSQQGRQQAAEIGALFRDNGIKTARVMSSEWCRCLDTAEQLDLGPVERLPELNSFFENMAQRESQTAALKSWLRPNRAGKPALVLVTHQVNISALTGRFARSGEIIVVKWGDDGGFEPLGSLSGP